MKMFVSGATLICQLLKLVSAILSLVTLRSPLKLNSTLQYECCRLKCMTKSYPDGDSVGISFLN